MGFHKRFITNDLVQNYYHIGGMEKLETLLSADAYICESGIASDFISLANSDLSEQDLCNATKELMKNDIYIKGIMLPDEVSKAKIFEIVYNSEHSRDEKLIQLKSYLGEFIDELNAYGIEYTYLASRILTEYYEQTKAIKNNG